MTIAIYPGSFDPVHNGHIDIAERAAQIFEKLVVSVYARPFKNVLFTPEERTRLVRESVTHLSNVQVLHMSNTSLKSMQSAFSLPQSSLCH